MSKKIAAGADCIVLDVKTGSGAFMKTLDDSKSWRTQWLKSENMLDVIRWRLFLI